MIVLNAHRPIRNESILDTGADRFTKPVLRSSDGRPTSPGKYVIVAAGEYCAAALEIEQRVTPGISDLSGEEPENINSRAIDCITGSSKEKCIADAGAVEA
jgi:hypothetical protein